MDIKEWNHNYSSYPTILITGNIKYSRRMAVRSVCPNLIDKHDYEEIKVFSNDKTFWRQMTMNVSEYDDSLYLNNLVLKAMTSYLNGEERRSMVIFDNINASEFSDDLFQIASGYNKYGITLIILDDDPHWITDDMSDCIDYVITMMFDIDKLEDYYSDFFCELPDENCLLECSKRYIGDNVSFGLIMTDRLSSRPWRDKLYFITYQ